ncbi:MAG: Gfo/Idh/MocA family oxidoreductase [Bacteroidaceae bacterium]|nr:Gfo/Idh/MocA family oxidoreductase [Bacteroidaceae bacterium]
MSKFMDCGIQCWRSQKRKKMLRQSYSAQYAFVGVGGHALQNLYPVLQYFGIRLKYICCKSPGKLPFVERRFGVTATTSLDTILNDSEVKGVFVCTSPQLHYEICIRVMASGKFLFVEKPPCRTLEQLDNMIRVDRRQTVMTGMQKRYSPLTQTLKEHLSKTEAISYTLSYHTGAYPEGDSFTDLFIHPVDLASYLFGDAKVRATRWTDGKGTTTVQSLLSHREVNGVIEMSTAYSWAHPEESLRVNTMSGEYRLEQMERLLHYPHPRKIAGIPVEKLGLFTASEQMLMGRNNFTPLIMNNQLYTQGFFSEIKAFADMVEHSGKNLSPLSSMRNTYGMLELMK